TTQLYPRSLHDALPICTSVAAQLYSALAEQSQRVPDALLLFGPAVERFKFRTVSIPDDTFLVHGETDEVVPLSEAMDFARERDRSEEHTSELQSRENLV